MPLLKHFQSETETVSKSAAYRAGEMLQAEAMKRRAVEVEYPLSRARTGAASRPSRTSGP
jgi:hypothetical protein